MYKFEKDDGTLYTGVVSFNGDILGRQFEDMYFHADMVDGVVDPTTARVASSDEDYFSQYNKKSWLKEATKIFKNEDEYFDIENNTDQIWVADDVKSSVEPQALQMESLSPDMFSGLK